MTRAQITRQIKRLHAENEPLNISAVNRAHPELIEAVYAVEPFWGWRQALRDAGIQYRHIKVHLEAHVQCRICGAARERLVQHLKHDHELTCDEYLDSYPDAETFSEGVRARSTAKSFITGKKARLLMPHWEPIWTAEYVLDRAYELQRRKKPVHEVAIHDNEPSMIKQAANYFDTWDDVLRRIGLDPIRIRLSIPHEMWTKKNVRDELHRLHAEGADMQRQSLDAMGHRHLCHAGRRFFGSHEAALTDAGIDTAEFKHVTPKGYSARDRERLHRDMKKVASMADPIAHHSAVRKFREQYRRMVGTLYGEDCWGRAAKDAGVQLRRIQALPGAYPTAQHVIREIRRLMRDGKPVNFSAMTTNDLPLRRKGRECFGSWDGALEAAGLKPEKIRRRG